MGSAILDLARSVVGSPRTHLIVIYLIVLAVVRLDSLTAAGAPGAPVGVRDHGGTRGAERPLHGVLPSLGLMAAAAGVVELIRRIREPIQEWRRASRG